ncbi:MAG: PAS domain-containing protein, partial [bacterium]
MNGEHRQSELSRQLPQAAEEALRISEGQKRAILNGITANVAFVDKDLQLLWVNVAAAKSVNKSPAEMIGQTCYAFWADPAKPCQNCPTLKAFQTKQTEHAFMHTPDGRIWDERGEPVFDELGDVIGVVEIAQDITERKRAEEAYIASEFKYRALIEHSSDVVFCVDRNGEYKFVNQVFASTFGKTPDYFLGKTFWDIYPKEHADHRQAANDKVFETGQSQSLEVVVPLPDRTLYFIAKANPVRDETGKVVLNLTHATDITERKLAEDALQESEAKLSNALQMAHAGHWEYDVDRDLFTFNDNFYRIFRTTAAAVGGYQMSSQDYARKFCHPDDLAVVANETRAAIESTDPNFSRQIEHRILYADGEAGVITVRFFIVKDPQGRTIKTYGVNQDITDRKRAEEALRESE